MEVLGHKEQLEPKEQQGHKEQLEVMVIGDLVVPPEHKEAKENKEEEEALVLKGQEDLLGL